MKLKKKGKDNMFISYEYELKEPINPHTEDTTHKVYMVIYKNKMCELHRFNNAGGVPYSAIYVDGKEYYNNIRENEKEMLKYYFKIK